MLILRAISNLLLMWVFQLELLLTFTPRSLILLDAVTDSHAGSEYGCFSIVLFQNASAQIVVRLLHHVIVCPLTDYE